MHRFGSSLARLRTSARRSVPVSWRHRLHTPPQLKYRIEEGLGEFLPPKALQTVAVDYQQGLLTKLNEEVQGTKYEGQSIVDTIVESSVERQSVLTFNYASLALNNHFFLEHLRPIPSDAEDHQHKMSEQLAVQIRRQHGSLAQLKSSFSAAALGMFTNGWMWLVMDSHGNMAVLPTFGPGTLLVRSRSYIAPTYDSELQGDLLQSTRGLPLDPTDPYFEEFQQETFGSSESATPTPTPTPRQTPPGTQTSSLASGASVSTKAPPNPPHTRSMSSLSEGWLQSGVYDPESPTPQKGYTRSELYQMGEQLFPLFCISINEHAWMSAGYGVWGKEEWLKKFWTVLDWEKVSKNYSWYISTEAEKSNLDQE